MNKKWFLVYLPREIKEKLSGNFYEKRKKGENDHKLCELIRNDMTKEFLMYISRYNISLNATIQPSIYEINLFLIKKQN